MGLLGVAGLAPEFQPMTGQPCFDVCETYAADVRIPQKVAFAEIRDLLGCWLDHIARSINIWVTEQKKRVPGPDRERGKWLSLWLSAQLFHAGDVVAQDRGLLLDEGHAGFRGLEVHPA